MRLLFACNQGGLPVVALNAAIAEACHVEEPDCAADFAVWHETEKAELASLSKPIEDVHCFESFRRADRFELNQEVNRLVSDYPETNWSAVIASERSFTDASLLLGAAGPRTESQEYVERLLVGTVRFFEHIFSRRPIDAIVCQTADSLFTHVLFKVAGARSVPLLAITPAWINEEGKPGTFFTNDEYLRCDGMIAKYDELRFRELTQHETDRAEKFRREVVEFDGNKTFYAATKRNFGRSAIPPNITRIISHIAENARRDKNVDYRKFDVVKKLRANIVRAWRKYASAALIGRAVVELPERSVFFALHFQPEQSTLVGGIMHANQVALIETISKSLPLGYMLVVKEHPAGRGSRPAWQYRHLASFPNVMFCDLPSKEIVAKVKAVIAISGSIAVEAMALDKPIIVLGRSFFDYADALYRLEHATALPALLRRILIDDDYANRQNRKDLILKFLLSYVSSVLPFFPTQSNAHQLAAAIVSEVKKSAGQ